MKEIKLFLLIMLASIITQAQSIVLEFHANHTCTQVGLDSIWIQNLSQGGKMVLYYPDNIAVFVVIDITDFDPQHNQLYVSQNYPNPFSALTYIDVYLPTPDVVSLNVYDLKGRTVARYEDVLEEGMHRFSFSAGFEKTYILTVTSNKHVEKRIMLQMGLAVSAVSEISYLGASSEKEPKTAPKSSDFNFSPGDSLRLTGYVTDFTGNVDYGVIYDAPEASTAYLFDIAKEKPSEPTGISGEGVVCENVTNLIYETSHVDGVSFLWTVPDDWTVTEGQGTHMITIDAGSLSGDIRVVAVNACGTSDEVAFPVTVIEITPPLVSTACVTDVTPFSAVSGGIVKHDQCANVAARGVVWDTIPVPCIENNFGMSFDGSGSGTFTSTLTGLSPASSYYFRAYATNESGTAYGDQGTLNTPGGPPTIDYQFITGRTKVSAVLNAMINPNHLETTVVFEYGLTEGYGNDVVAEQSPIDGGDEVLVSALIEDLQPGTVYHFRVIARNLLGEAFGNCQSFITLGGPPAIVGQFVKDRTTESALLNALIHPNHFETTVIFEYGLTADYGNEVVAEQSPVDGGANVPVNVFIDGLAPGTKYHYRVAAENEMGVSYGAGKQFTTYDTVTDIDGNVYYTIKIGSQEWMAENLRVTRYNNEDNIPLIMDDAHWSNTTGGAYTIYDHNAWNTDGIDSPKDMVAIYGKLYNWYAATDARGFCPEGWSLPSNDDWVQLVDFVVNQGYPNEINNPNGAGNALKSCRQVNSPLDGCQTSEHPRYNQQSWHYGFDEFGFTAIPAGRRWPYGLFHLIGGYSNYWTSTEHSTVSAISHNIINSSGSVIQQNTLGKRSGFSVRCFRGLVPPEEE